MNLELFQQNLESAQMVFHLVSLGCPKNLIDSEIMLAKMFGQKHAVTPDPARAEIIIVNTCGFIESAKQESVEKILEMAEFKIEGQLKMLIVTGCLTQRYKEDLAKELPEVDLFVGTGDFQNIAEIVESKLKGVARQFYFDKPTYLDHEGFRINSQPKFRAYIKISEGCLKRCSFCAIPRIRGNLQSRAIPSIVQEAEGLATEGVKELIVLSHDFTDFGWDLTKNKTGPVKLLEALASIDRLEWIRLLYLYPDGLSNELLEVIKKHDKIVKYFDLPFQHINNEMLRKMNRKTDRSKLENIISRIRSEIPNAFIRTQFIVGFPGESEEQFSELMEFVEAAQFDHMGCFVYSPEEGTPAALLEGAVADEIKNDRFHRLMQLQRRIVRRKNQKLIGKVFPVLIEGVSSESELLLEGRTYFQAPEIDGVVLINEGNPTVGSIVEVEITDANDYDLIGRARGS